MATMRDVDEATNKLTTATVDQTSNARAKIIIELIILLGDAIMEEQGLRDPSEVNTLPKDTVLGSKAEAAFNALREQLPS